ncbi:MAG TPA: hypothetical protein VGY76_05625 [Solirubrobacteraceae bacterium]|nr:hypothetical protein [Solirubrobacteraceae bacterium]
MLLAVCAVIVFGIGVSWASTSAPAPAWGLQGISQPTELSSADNGRVSGNLKCAEEESPPFTACDRYSVVLTNIGTIRSSGIVTVTDTLPEGITTAHLPGGYNYSNEFTWICETNKGGPREIVTCKAETSVPALAAAPAIEIPVNVSLGIPPGTVLTNEVQATGGGAAAPVQLRLPSPVEGVLPSFGPLDFSFSALDQAGGASTQAAAHPGGLATSFTFPTAYSFKSVAEIEAFPLEDVKQIVTDLPAGVVGDALAAPTCSLSDLTNLTTAETQCPAATRVGKLILFETQATETELVIFNVTPEPGHAAEFGVFLPTLQKAALLYASVVGQGADTHVRVMSAPQPAFGVIHIARVSLIFHGIPAVIDNTPVTPVAFATNPANCQATGFTATMYVDTWQHPARMLPDGGPANLGDPAWKRATSTMPAVTGCSALAFEPTLTFAPEPNHSGASEPAGYESVLRVPQDEDPHGLATPPLKTAVVTVPAGVAISPSAANGLVGCQETGPEGIELGSNQPGHCPAAATIGQVELATPLLKEVLKGSVFVAQPACGASGQQECTEEAAEVGGVFALYLEAGSENTGIHLKLKGKIEVGGNGHHNDLAPGQIRTTFTETPQQPFTELKLNFQNGPGAPLANPTSCGAYSATSSLTPWSASTQAPKVPSPAFQISGCEEAFTPTFNAGTTSNQAGSFSPFVVTLTRKDREQDFSGLTVHMPEGLLGTIAGIARCPEAQAATGACPASSRVGTASAAAGAGSRPYWQSGPVYLTGPYRGAPFGLSVVIPAKAGPYNFGNIIVRAQIEINPLTAQVSVVSDPLPQIIDGVPLRVQTVNVTVDRSGFIFNPTSCDQQQIIATITAAQGASAQVSSHFQAAGCAALGFHPVFSVSTQANTSKHNGASLTVKTTFPTGAQANIHSVAVTLPKQLPSRLTTIQQACTQATFAANPASCPTGSLIGMATATTPVLTNPLTGPAYLVSHGGAAFPDVVMVLQGEGITLDVIGGVSIKHGITSSTFANIPDAPLTGFKLTLPEGPHSALAAVLPAKAKGSLCGQSLAMPFTITGQNGAILKQNTKIAITGCATKKTKHKGKAKKKKKRK